MISTYYTKISANFHNKIIENTLSKFPMNYQNKILKYRRWQDAQSSIVGRLLLLHGIRQLDNSILFNDFLVKYTEYNKPYLECSPIKFNISHSNEIVVCSITCKEDIGIDIEKIKPIKIHDFKEKMTKLEWEYVIKSKNTQTAFYHYWTKKEALVKANGKGLSIPLDSFETIKSEVTIENSLYFVKELKIHNNYKCHLAIKKILNSGGIKSSIERIKIQDLI
tara:strand:- start:24 stop:689 length:666 start_codon:yes stop_codon:yes gene_type:complete